MIEMPGTSYRGVLPASDDALVALAEELHHDVTRLAVDIGERNVKNCPQKLARAADCIEAEFAAAGFVVGRQEYGVADTSCRNLEVEILGTTRHEEIVIVGCTTTRSVEVAGRGGYPKTLHFFWQFAPSRPARFPVGFQ